MGRVASATFVGRAAELAALDDAFEAAASGQTTTILIGADAGVGKSRLLTAWNDRARARGARVIAGWCLDVGDSGPAYAAVVQALRDLFESLDSSAVDAFVGTDRTAIARILPELSAGGGGIEDNGPSMPVAQTVVFQRLVDVLDRAAADRPLVLELEDLHWADPSTRAFLAFLVMILSAARLLIVGTFRSEELVRDHPLATTLRQLSRNPRVARLDLRPFEIDEVREQLTAIAGRPPSNTSLERIFARSEGNALFAEELVAVGDAGVELPNSIGEALLARSSGLSNPARTVLRLASVAGRTVTYRTLQAAGSLEEDRLADALREAVAANILEAEHTGERYRFRHALLQEAMYRDALPGERRRLHADVAEALESTVPEPLTDPELVPQLARHWLEAGDIDRALPAMVAAGDLAVRQSAHAEAVRHYERALDLWDHAATGSRNLSRTEILDRASRSAYVAGEPVKAIEFAERALADLDESTDPILLVGTLDNLRLAWDHVGDEKAVLKYATRLAAVEPAGLPLLEQTRILGGRTMVLQRQGDFARATDAANQLQQLVDGGGDAGLQARAHLTMGWMLLEAADLDAAVREARLALDLAMLAGDGEAQVQAYSLSYEAAWAAGRREDTIAATRAFRAFADRVGLLRWEGPWAALAEAEALYQLGRLGECLAVVEEQLRDPPADRSLPLLHLIAAEVAIARGSLSVAAEWLEQGSAETTAGDDEIAIGHVSLVRARLANADGRLDDVRSIVFATAPVLAAAVPHTNTADLTWGIVEIGLEAEASRAEAADAAADVEARAEARGVAMTLSGYVEAVRARRQEAGVSDRSRHRGEEAVIAGHLARIDGRDDPALWAAAADAFPSGSVESLAARYRQAEAMLVARSTSEELGAVVSPAYARAVEIGASPLIARFESVARRSRIRLRVPDIGAQPQPSDLVEVAAEPGHVALRKRGLSEREIEVLALVASGYTNADIGERLFITSKTASVHVSHILDKLGASSRTEAATIGVRLGLPEVEPPES
jgi:DNA-binding NarL/FixJ family response regulator/tetratricopeptide (TPR) repeat protein